MQTNKTAWRVKSCPEKANDYQEKLQICRRKWARERKSWNFLDWRK